MKRPFIWAHRGVSARAPENTMAAFHAVLESGADGIELDVHVSADGVPVVIHDESLFRTTDGVGRVDKYAWKELQCLDAGRWYADEFAGEAIPSLEEVLRTFSSRLRLNLELKEYRAGKAVLALLSRFPDADIVLSSFDHRLLSKLRSEDNKLSLAVLCDGCGWHESLKLASDLKSSSFHPRADTISRLMVSRCHTLDLPVYPWTVDAPEVVRKVQRAGVDGFFSNDPQTARSAWFVS